MIFKYSLKLEKDITKEQLEQMVSPWGAKIFSFENNQKGQYIFTTDTELSDEFVVNICFNHGFCYLNIIEITEFSVDEIEENSVDEMEDDNLSKNLWQKLKDKILLKK